MFRLYFNTIYSQILRRRYCYLLLPIWSQGHYVVFDTHKVPVAPLRVLELSAANKQAGCCFLLSQTGLGAGLKPEVRAPIFRLLAASP